MSIETLAKFSDFETVRLPSRPMVAVWGGGEVTAPIIYGPPPYFAFLQIGPPFCELPFLPIFLSATNAAPFEN